jgi:hypothetical protein
MKLIIAGSRSLDNYTSISKIIEEALREKDWEPAEVVCGEASGVDTVGKYWANAKDIPVKSFPAKWKDLKAGGAIVRENKYGKYNARAGFDRNEKMAVYADALLLIWDGVSSGSMDMLDRAKKHNLQVCLRKYGE